MYRDTSKVRIETTLGATMKFAKFGTTDLMVSRIGFGMWPIGGTIKSGDYGVTDLDQSILAVQQALDLGISLFDAAPAYGNGLAEKVLAKGLKGRREDAIISTKCGIYYEFEKKVWIRDSHKEAIIESADQSLRRLQTDYIDIFLIHWPDDGTPPESAMDGLLELQKSGKVKYVGVSNFSIPQINTYEKYGILYAQQVGYNIFDRRIEGKMLQKCEKSGMGVMGYGSLCHGLLTGVWDEDFRFNNDDWRSQGDVFGLQLFTEKNLPINIRVTQKLKKYAQELGLTLPQLSLAWVMHNPSIAVGLTGMSTKAEVLENVLAADAVLSDSDMKKIEEIMKEATGTKQLHKYDFNDAKKD